MLTSELIKHNTNTQNNIQQISNKNTKVSHNHTAFTGCSPYKLHTTYYTFALHEFSVVAKCKCSVS